MKVGGLMTVDVVVLIGLIGTICSIIFGFVGYRKGLKKENIQTGTLLSDVGYIKSGVDDLKRKQETAEERHFSLAERVTKVEESSKQAHKRIDTIEGKRRD